MNVVGKEDTAAKDAVHAELAEHFTLAVKRLQDVGLTQFMGEHKVGSHCASTSYFHLAADPMILNTTEVNVTTMM